MLDHKKMSPTSVARPALLTGTSSEYLGKRAIPRILRRRPVIMVLGPKGVGKTSVGMRLSRLEGKTGLEPAPLYLDTQELQDALVERISQCQWTPRLLDSQSLVLDGPIWLRNRPAAVDMLTELLNLRTDRNHRTLVCQSAQDWSVEVLMGAMLSGSMAVVGLRFPKGPRGRARFASRVCDDLGIERIAAKGTENLEPWGYDRVVAYLEGWKRGRDAPQ